MKPRFMPCVFAFALVGVCFADTLKPLKVSYGHADEFNKFSLTIVGREATYIYNKRVGYIWRKEPVVAQRPHYSAADMVTVHTRLSEADAKDLRWLIVAKKFMTARDGKKSNTKTYPGAITVSLGGKPHTLLGNGHPNPDAYLAVAERLQFLISRKILKMKAPAL